MLTVVLCLLGQPTSFHCLQKRKRNVSFIKNKNFLMQREVCMSDLAWNMPLLLNFPVLQQYLWWGLGTFKLVKLEEAEQWQDCWSSNCAWQHFPLLNLGGRCDLLKWLAEISLSVVFSPCPLPVNEALFSAWILSACLAAKHNQERK